MPVVVELMAIRHEAADEAVSPVGSGLGFWRHCVHHHHEALANDRSTHVLDLVARGLRCVIVHESRSQGIVGETIDHRARRDFIPLGPLTQLSHSFGKA
jgi:hypothetical protein